MIGLTALSNDVRSQRREIRVVVKAARPKRAGMARLADELEGRPACLNRVRIWDALDWVSHMDQRSIALLLRHAGVRNEFRLLGELSDRQVEALVFALRSPALTTGRAR